MDGHSVWHLRHDLLTSLQVGSCHSKAPQGWGAAKGSLAAWGRLVWQLTIAGWLPSWQGLPKRHSLRGARCLCCSHRATDAQALSVISEGP